MTLARTVFVVGLYLALFLWAASGLVYGGLG